MRERHVVIVAFDGLQPLDAVGPHEVFAGAARAAASLGRAGGYRVTARLDRRRHGPRRERARARDTVRCPEPAERIDTLVLAGRQRRRRRRRRRVPGRLDPPTPPHAAAGSRPCARAPSSVPRRACSTGAASTTHWARAGQLRDGLSRASRSTPTRSTSATGSTGRAPGSRPASTSRWRWSRRTWASTWPRPWPAGWSCSCTARAARPSSPRRSGSRAPSARPCGPCRRSSRPRPAATTASRRWPRRPP